jgi:hypothetical protein
MRECRKRLADLSQQGSSTTQGATQGGKIGTTQGSQPNNNDNQSTTIAHNQELNTDALFIGMLDDDFARMTARPNLMARYQIAGNDTRGQEL